MTVIYGINLFSFFSNQFINSELFCFISKCKTTLIDFQTIKPCSYFNGGFDSENVTHPVRF